jgi:PQQ-dependent dehydrogenase (methanol/ethanol family)
MRCTGLVVLAAALVLAACQRGGEAADVDAERIIAAEKNGEWLSYGRTYSEQRYSPLDQINAGNVQNLGLAWYAEFETDRAHEATPVIADGVLYTTTSWSNVHAFDAASGKALWSWDAGVNRAKGFDACCDVANRGVAVWKGRVYVGTLDGRLVALDAKTGKPDWSVQTTDNAQPYTITGAPRVIKGKVIIGNGGAEYGVRGYVSAYDAETGAQAWRFYTTPNPKDAADGAASDRVLAQKARGTWFGEGWKTTGGGGTVWDAMAYDPELDLLYIGVGNGSPWNHQVRSDGKGDNLFVSSIVALKPETGDYVWHYQTTPGETWDYTATQHIMLADLPIGGKTRRVVMQAPKNGFFYVLDARTGQFISANNYAPINWATGVDPKTGRPIEAPGARYQSAPFLAQPGPYGAHNWHPMAFSPKENLVYIPVINTPFAYANDPAYKHAQGGWNTATDSVINALPTDEAQAAAVAAMIYGELVAWDPVAQKERWRVRHPFFWNAGVLATAGGLVFQGSAEGAFTAYGAGGGQKLWSYDAGQGIIAAPATYAIDGEQYVAVMVGYGGAGPTSANQLLGNQRTRPGRLMVFKLGGKATAPRPEVAEVPALDLTAVSSSGDPAQGFALYQGYCQVCHSPRAAGGFLPDLKRSPMILSAESFKGVVIDGVNAPRGMASFRRFLTPAQAEDIRAFIIQEAKAPVPPPAPGKS